MATGIGWMVGACVGNIAAIPSINCKCRCTWSSREVLTVHDLVPGLCVEDGPLGVRYADLGALQKYIRCPELHIDSSPEVSAFPAYAPLRSRRNIVKAQLSGE